MKDDRLSECRQSLQEHNFEEELANGAKVFVEPLQYEPLLRFIRSSKYKFRAWHLFVQTSLEGAVMDIMGEVNAKKKKKKKRVLCETLHDRALSICSERQGNRLQGSYLADL